MKRTLFATLIALTLVGSAPAHAAGNANDELPYQKVGRCDDKLIRGNQAMLQALQAIRKKLGKKPQIFSCWRSQSRQNNIRKSYGCGPSNCRGRAAKHSQHTYGVAADIRIPGKTGRAMCDFLSGIRDSVIGHGGVGAYKDGSGHLDVRPGRCAWNKCGYLGCSNQYRSKKVSDYMSSRRKGNN